MRRWIGCALTALCLSGIAIVRTDGFSPSAINAPLSTVESPRIPLEVHKILSQPFYYLSKGRQSFVFASEDGKYVLKFFNHKYLKIPWYSFLREKKERAKRTLRRQFYENSYEIAKRELGEEIIYLHLAPAGQAPIVHLIDRASREYALDLTDLPFVLQRKGEPFYTSLESIYQKEGMKGLCREIDSWIGLISLRISKNIADADQDVEHNWGYVDGKIFHLDPGRLYYEDLSDSSRQKEEWRRATRSFCKWLEVHYPEAANYFEGGFIPLHSKMGSSDSVKK